MLSCSRSGMYISLKTIILSTTWSKLGIWYQLLCVFFLGLHRKAALQILREGSSGCFSLNHSSKDEKWLYKIFLTLTKKRNWNWQMSSKAMSCYTIITSTQAQHSPDELPRCPYRVKHRRMWLYAIEVYPLKKEWTPDWVCARVQHTSTPAMSQTLD